tara:strand:+ start:175 stop:1347 length:1173 start_codon:yes stop_codon:yes gene_type:complete
MSTLKVGGIRGVSASSDAITVANDGTCTANITSNGGGQLSNRNKIINGAMAVHQRASSVTGITSSGIQTADRWGYSVNVGTWTNTISTDTPDGFANSYKLDCTATGTPASNDILIFYQVIEGQNLQDFAKGTSSAKQFAVSFNIKTNKTGTYILELYDADNNRQVSQSYTVSNTNWNRYTIIFPADTSGAFGNDNGASLYLQWWLAAGTNFTTGTLNTSWGNVVSANRVVGLNVNLADNTSNEWLITGVQLEVGSVATDFEHRSFAQELALCQRYFYALIRHDGSMTGAQSLGGTGSFYSPDNVYMSINFPVTMRATPTFSCVNKTNAFRFPSEGSSRHTPTLSMVHAHSNACTLYAVTTTTTSAGNAANSIFDASNTTEGDGVFFSAEI